MNMLGEGKIESVGKGGAELSLIGGDSRTTTLRLAEPGSSVTRAYGLFGAAEEVSDDQIRHQIDTNLIGVGPSHPRCPAASASARRR
jgi:hypothetical protein